MIPESAGASPAGIFQLADAFRSAAVATLGVPKHATSGPTRLLAYHACELFLKSFLREHGQDVEVLRSHGHDLHAILEAAISEGLLPSSHIIAQLKKVTDKNDYVRVRYMVVEHPSDIPAEKVMTLLEAVRECVRLALDYDELGNPIRKPAVKGPANHAKQALRKPANSALKSR